MKSQTTPIARRPSMLDHAWTRERAHRGTPGRLVSAGTIRRIKDLGLLSGWHCAEIGEGAAPTALWLAPRVGRLGRVVAVDVDSGRLARLCPDALDLRCHDIGSTPLEAGAYDLVHSRMSLLGSPRRGQVVSNMVASLRPGGWLLAEDEDTSAQGQFALMEEMFAAGLRDVRSEAEEAVAGAEAAGVSWTVSAWGRKPAAPFY